MFKHSTFKTAQQGSCSATTQVRQQRPGRACAHQSVLVNAAAQQQASLAGLKPSDSSKAADLKAEVTRLAGNKNGTDLAPEQHADVKQLLQQLEVLNPAQQVLHATFAGRNVYRSSQFMPSSCCSS